MSDSRFSPPPPPPPVRYRKHFTLPADWRGGATWVYFEEVHHYSYVWLNGRPLGRHINGYLSFWHRLDTNGAKFGEGEINVLAVAVNSDPGSDVRLPRRQADPAPVAGPHGFTGIHAPRRGVGPRVLRRPQQNHTVGCDVGARGRACRQGVVHAAAGPVQDVWVTADFMSGSTVVAMRTVGPLAVGANGTNFTIRATLAAVTLWAVPQRRPPTSTRDVRCAGNQVRCRPWLLPQPAAREAPRLL